MDDVSLLGVSQIDRVVEAVEETLKGKSVRSLQQNRPLPSLTLPKVRRNKFVEIIAINAGCLGSCTFCKTKQARGKLRSHSVESLVARARHAAEEGVTEIWLTSEDTGAYGLDLGTDVSVLLRAMVEALRPYRQVMLHIGMTNPPYIMRHLDAVAEILNEPNVFEFIHIPVQSGSDRVLKQMVREYTRGEFTRLVSSLRAKVPKLSVMTDIICGFPSESESDFQETLSLIREFEFPFINISQFYARPNTPAARMQRLPSQVVKQRSTEVTRLFGSYTTNPFEMLGAEERVWFTEVDPKRSQTLGKTKNCTKALLEGIHNELLGQSRVCRVVGTHKWHLTMEPV